MPLSLLRNTSSPLHATKCHNDNINLVSLKNSFDALRDEDNIFDEGNEDWSAKEGIRLTCVESDNEVDEVEHGYDDSDNLLVGVDNNKKGASTPSTSGSHV